MRRSNGSRDKQSGQIIVLFALSIVVIMVFAAIVVDLGVLRNNKSILSNAVDSAALAGGTAMPVDGGGVPNSAAATAANNRVVNTLLANYPSLTSAQYTITYRCLIGITNSTPAKPNIGRDIPIVCNPGFSLGWSGSTSLAVKEGAFTGAGDTRSSSCNPFVGDKCNTVVVAASSNTNYSFGRVVGVDSGSSGAILSAACNGPCGQPPSIPVDLVMIIDRTGSMLTPVDKVADTRRAAEAVLGVYDPALQRVAFGLLGPSNRRTTCAGPGGPAVSPLLQTNFTLTAPAYQSNRSAANVAAGAPTLVINRPNGTSTGDVLVAGITVAGGIKIGAGAGTTVTAPSGWTLIRATTNLTNVGMATYYRVAGTSEPSSYTWGLSPNARASGGIMGYSGVDTTNPINISAGAIGNAITNPFRVTPPSVTTTSAETALVAFYGIGANATFTNNVFTEQFDVRNSSNAPSTATEGAEGTQTSAGPTGNNNYATATAGGQWVAQQIALNPVPVDGYGTDPTKDLAQWIPVGFTGTDGDSPAPAYNEAYSNGSGTLNNASHLMSAINCFDAGGNTNLATPIDMAAYYLQNYGRPNVQWGIILETDGQPNYQNSNPCAVSNASATTAKAIKNAKGQPIQVFTIGFGLDGNNNATCPDNSGVWRGKKATQLLASMATQPSSDALGCPGTGTPNSNTDGDHFLCVSKNGSTADLAAVFSQVASQLAGIRTHLVQLYPPPIVTSLSSNVGTRAGGVSITVNGEYFSGATSVRMGGAPVTFSVNNDNLITISATAPGTLGTTVDIVVTSPGGSSPIVGGDRYTYN